MAQSCSFACRNLVANVEQRVLLDQCKRRAAALQIIRPVMVKIERRTMVDQPQVILPHQQVDVAGSAVDVGDKGIKPDNM